MKAVLLASLLIQSSGAFSSPRIVAPMRGGASPIRGVVSLRSPQPLRKAVVLRGEEDFGGVEAGSAAGDGASGAATAVYKFLRPHTIRGTILASVTGVVCGHQQHDELIWQ